MTTKKYKHRIDTMDGVIESESDTPPIRHKTSEEIEAEHVLKIIENIFKENPLPILEFNFK
jgi:hypothetical protein